MNDDYSIDPTPVGVPAGTQGAATARRSGTLTMARIGLLGIASAALVAAAILLVGATAPSRTLAINEDLSGTSNGSVEGLNGFRGGPGGPGGPGFGHGLGGITITAISGSSLSLETVDGWTRTITVADDTTYSKSGDTIGLEELAVGDEIRLRQTRETDGTFTIDAIVVIPPQAGGEVTAVDGSTITVDQRDGTSVTINVTSSTTYEVDGDAATLADVKVGMKLTAEGTANADGSLNATEVRAADLDGSRGPGRHGDRGFGFGFGPGFDFGGDKDDGPDATTAPAATDSAS